MHHAQSIDTTLQACDEISWNGVTYYNDTTLVFTQIDYKGCDSIVTAHLIIQPTPVAAMALSHYYLTEDRLWTTATDTTSQPHSRRWLINGVFTDTVKSLRCQADLLDDSLGIVLVVCNGVCCDTAEISIPVQHGFVMFPNVFTPVAEDVNSRFCPRGSGVERFELRVFNRQGLEVFHSRSMEDCWDGTCKGVPCPQGSYVYIVRYSLHYSPEKWLSSSGSMLLLR